MKKKGIKKLSESEKEIDMRKAKSNARMEETLHKIERKTNSEQKDEEWDE